MPLERDDGWSGWKLALLVVVEIWLAHALVLFAHEYAHSFTAWALGWKHNPLDLDYSRPSLLVFLLQAGVNQKVDEDAIFHAGQGFQGGLIAAAGMVLGNALISYPIARLGLLLAKRSGQAAVALLFFWMTVASVGNLFDYVPIRTFDGGISDMEWVERGFRWSSLITLLILGLPALLAMIDLLARVAPQTLDWLFPMSYLRRAFLGVLSASFIFCFYGAAGLSESGPASEWLSRISIFVLAPIMALTMAWLTRDQIRTDDRKSGEQSLGSTSISPFDKQR